MVHRPAREPGFAVSKDSAHQLCCRWNNELISLFNAYKVISASSQMASVKRQYSVLSSQWDHHFKIKTTEVIKKSTVVPRSRKHAIWTIRFQTRQFRKHILKSIGCKNQWGKKLRRARHSIFVCSGTFTSRLLLQTIC